MAKRRRRRRRLRNDPIFRWLIIAWVIALGMALTAQALGNTGTTLLVVGLVALLVAFAVWRIIRKRRRRRKQLLDSRDIGSLLAITPTEFEHRVALILGANGYRDVKVSGGPGDLAVDITGRDTQGAQVAVQCKQYAHQRKVGTPEVQTFIGMAFAHHGAAKGLYVTTGGYTQGARELAAQHGIQLIDGQELVAMARTGSPDQ
jgi:restriction system protein